MISGFIRWRSLFESDVGRSEWLHEIAPQILTLRQDPRFRYREPRYGKAPPDLHHDTPFCEINMVPRKETWGSEVKELLDNLPARKQVERSRFLEEVYSVFVDVVENAWIPERFHVVLHSGGYDSRLISWTIKELYEKNGPEWLGNILFVELEGETEESWNALKAEGWDESLFMSYRADARSGEHHGHLCNFADAWRRTNGGMWAKGFNHWYDSIEWLQEIGHIPSSLDQLQNWTGIYSNEISCALTNGPGIEWMFDILFYHIYSLIPTKGEWVAPFLNLDLIRVVHEYGLGHRERDAYTYPLHILEWLAPEVAKLPKPPAGRSLARWRGLSPDLCQQMLREYRVSWYGRNVAPDVEIYANVGLSPWWGHWGLASLCEKLLRGGHKIIPP